METKRYVESIDLSGLVAVVTGAGDGIGRACAEILAGAGAQVVVSDLSPSRAVEVAGSICRSGGMAVGVECDVSSESDLSALVDETVNRFGTVNILVNNAGIGGGGREDPMAIDSAYVERVYRINLFAPWQLCRMVVPYMESSGYGSIVNITSMSSVNCLPAMAIYASSKAALNHMTANLAYDFGPKGVRINCVGPGATRTRALDSVLTPEIESSMLRHTPLGRLGETSDIAQTVLFLASPMSAWITGQTIMVNGGGVQTLD